GTRCNSRWKSAPRKEPPRRRRARDGADEAENMKARGWATTDVGLKRDHNEDSYLCNEQLNLYAVADGMGGHLGGERASRLAIEILEREMEARLPALNAEGSSTTASEAMRDATRLAAQTIYDEAQKR